MRKSLFGLLLAFMLLCGSSSVKTQTGKTAQIKSLCGAEEQVLFSCVVKGSAKIASICGSKELDRERGYVQYRFGKSGKVELEFPQDRQGSQAKFRYAHYFRAQMDRTEINFDNAGFEYTVFDYYEGDIKPPTRKSGVTVRTSGANPKETTYQCTANPRSNYAVLGAALPCDKGNALSECP